MNSTSEGQAPDLSYQDFLQKISGAEAKVPLQEFFLDWMGLWPARQALGRYMELRTWLRERRSDRFVTYLEEVEERLADVLAARTAQPGPEEVRDFQNHHFLTSQEFPQIKAGHDEDIPAYYQLRGLRDLPAAKSVYGRLVLKYPHAESRICLLRFWRTQSRLFLPLFLELKNALGERLAQNIRKSISYILKCFTEDSSQTALSLFARIKNAVRLLPSDKLKAVALLRKLLGYAERLDYHHREFSSVGQVLEDYFGESLFARKEIRLILPSSTDSRQRRPTPRVETFDIDRVTFAPEVLRLIEINPLIQGLENITLAYCYQYWTLAQNSDFENQIYLYSLKHHGPHLSVFQIIKKGQQAAVKDEDILYAVYNVLVKGSVYEYSVRKDIYMQSVWNRIKPGPESPEIQDSRLFAEEQIRIMREEKKRRLLKASEKVKAEQERRKHHRSEAEIQVRRKKEQAGLLRQKAQEKVEWLKKAKEARRIQAQNLHKLEKDSHPFTPVVEKNLQDEWTRYEAPERTVLLPISSRINEMDHSEQKNLHLIFRRRVETEIQMFLDRLAVQTGQSVKTVNRTLAVLAIKEFIFNNYDHPARNWIVSNERLKVKELGLTVTDVEPIIESCLAHLQEELAEVI